MSPFSLKTVLLSIAFLFWSSESYLTDGLILFYNFDNATWPLKDSGPYGLHGTCNPQSTCPTYNAAGFYGGSMNFSQSYFRVASHVSQELQNITVGTWLYTNANSNWAKVISKPATTTWKAPWCSWCFTSSVSGDLDQELRVSNGDDVWNTTSDRVPRLNEWVHLAATWDGKDTTFFVNGLKIRTERSTINPMVIAYHPDNIPICVGARHNAQAGDFLFGKLDELAVWNRVLVTSEIATLYSPGLTEMIANQPSTIIASSATTRTSASSSAATSVASSATTRTSASSSAQPTSSLTTRTSASSSQGYSNSETINSAATSAVDTASSVVTVPIESQSGSTPLNIVGPTANEDKTNIVPIAAGISIGGVIIVCLVLVIVFLLVRRKRQQPEEATIALEDKDGTQNYGEFTRIYSSPFPGTGLPAELEPFKIGADQIEIFLNPIGTGASGVVYKGVWNQAFVAVKQLKTTSQSELKLLQEECKIMVEISHHENVLRMYGVTEEPFTLVLEYCQFGSLLGFINGPGPIGIDRKIKILADIARGMRHLQEHKIVHRDLAARNCLLANGFVAKVSDFGMSKMIVDNESLLTKTAYGPLKWMAPEIFRDKQYSFQTDIFSFGVTCIEVLTRQKPYPDITMEQFALTVLSKDLTTTLPSYIPPDTPPHVRQIVTGCLSKQPDQRPTFDRIVQTLEGARR